MTAIPTVTLSADDPYAADLLRIRAFLMQGQISNARNRFEFLIADAVSVPRQPESKVQEAYGQWVEMRQWREDQKRKSA